jgi:hypothetical protein
MTFIIWGVSTVMTVKRQFRLRLYGLIQGSASPLPD